MSLAIIKPLFDIYSGLGTAVTIFDSVKGKIDDQDPVQKREKLDALCADFDFSRIEDTHRQKVESYCQQFMRESYYGSFFSEEDIQELCRYYFEQNPAAYGDRENITGAIILFMETYDYWLHKNMSVGEQFVGHQLGLVHRNIMNGLEKLSDNVNSLSDKVDGLTSKVDTLIEQGKSQTPPPPPVTPPQPSLEPNSANTSYADAFQKVMFLHDEEKDLNVTLANLYVKPRYKEGEGKPDILPQRLADFVQNGNEHFLLIEGNAGNGKTTLVEWLSYHHRAGTKEAEELLGGRSLVTLRLRDMESGSLNNGLFTAVWSKLFPDAPLDSKKYAELLRTSLLVLDGFDELCTIDKLSDCNKILTEFVKKLSVSRLPVKVVVTSRPNYIGELSNHWNRVTLLPFNAEQREQWLDNYINQCKQTVADHIKTHILSLSDDKDGIFDTPLTLYMVAAKQPDEETLKNEWRLYHTIFFTDIRDTEYNQMAEADDFTYPSHPAEVYWDIYYRINEEIAYRMFQTNNSRLYVDADEVRDIIHELSKQDKRLEEQSVREIVRRCHALCGFWRVRTEDGYLEFYHNNIRDFFLCEKLYRELNALYQSKEWKDKENAQRLAGLVQYAEIPNKTVEFMRQRSLCGEEGKDDFCKKDYPSMEYERRHFPSMLQLLLTDGELLLDIKTPRKGWGGIHSKKPFQGMQLAVFGLISMVNAAVIPYLKEKECYPLVNDMKAVNENGTLNSLMKIKEYVFTLSRMDLSGAYLNCANLNFADLSCAGLRGALLFDTHLMGVDLSGSNLRGAGLEFANLSYADLNCADLIYVNMMHANLRTAKNLDKAKNLNKAKDLKYAILPDGFQIPAETSPTDK